MDDVAARAVTNRPCPWRYRRVVGLLAKSSHHRGTQESFPPLTQVLRPELHVVGLDDLVRWTSPCFADSTYQRPRVSSA